MDIVSEDLIRIIIFVGIVVWYIFSLIKRAKKGRQEPAKKTLSPSPMNEEPNIHRTRAEEKSIMEVMFPELVTRPPLSDPVQVKQNITPEEAIYTPPRNYDSGKERRLKKQKMEQEMGETKKVEDLLTFSSNPIIQGIIFSEIIGKPKSNEQQ